MEHLLWLAWSGAGLTWGRRAWTDWHDPEQDRAITAIATVIFALLLTVSGIILWMFA